MTDAASVTLADVYAARDRTSDYVTASPLIRLNVDVGEDVKVSYKEVQHFIVYNIYCILYLMVRTNKQVQFLFPTFAERDRSTQRTIFQKVFKIASNVLNIKENILIYIIKQTFFIKSCTFSPSQLGFSTFLAEQISQLATQSASKAHLFWL